jgi:hypothetical protein
MFFSCYNSQKNDGNTDNISEITENISKNVSWEYTTIRINGLNSNDITREANKLGQDGWELVTNTANGNYSTDLYFLIFKRKLS